VGEVFSILTSLDTGVFFLINRTLENPLFDLLMPILSTKRYALLPGAAAILMVLVWGGRRMWVVLAAGVVAVALSDVGCNVLKAAFHRIRPCHTLPDVRLLAGCTQSFSLPSNHASNMFAIAAVAWVGIRRFRWALALLAVGVAYSRAYLGVHYPGDVLAGAAWGGTLGWVCAQWVGRRWWSGRRVPGRHLVDDDPDPPG